MKVILTGISVMLVLILVFVNIADYALYSSKRNLIARGIDIRYVLQYKRWI